MHRTCAECSEWLSADEYSNNQWRKGPGYSRCMDCVDGCSRRGRICAECRCRCSPDEYSNNQWMKGEGISRCRDCLTRTYTCPQCNREFSSKNSLDMHMQVHRPRNVSCPLCGDTRFRSGANAVQHVESGYCSSCRGSANAREQIFRYVSRFPKMQRYLTDTRMITSGSGSNGSVPDYPYHCPQCQKYFRQLSQLLQHQDQKHNSRLMLTY